MGFTRPDTDGEERGCGRGSAAREGKKRAATVRDGGGNGEAGGMKVIQNAEWYIMHGKRGIGKGK
jgi:hypothetical protein